MSELAPSGSEAGRRKRRRRILGLAMILVSIALVLAGQFALGRCLQGVGFLFYWGACALFTTVALFIALSDLAVVRGEAAREERRLRRETFGDKSKPSKTEDKTRKSEASPIQ